MLKEERQQKILNEVELHNRIQLIDIAETLDVSVDTVRRDVKELDADQKLRKVHGGAISMGFTTNSTRNDNVYALAEKIRIVEKAITRAFHRCMGGNWPFLAGNIVAPLAFNSLILSWIAG